MRVFDGHNDLPWALRQLEMEGHEPNLGEDQVALGLHTDLPRLRAGGVAAQFWSVFVPCSFRGISAVEATLEQIALVHRIIDRYNSTLALARNADEVESAWSQGRIASLIGAEGGHCINDSLEVLESFHRLGVSYLTLTHNKNTSWAGSATDAPKSFGLTDFGKAVVIECNRLGILVDLSHTAELTMYAALETSKAPAFFSHSSAKAICSHPRNVSNDVLLRVRDTNGIVMVTFVPGFLTEECRQWFDRLGVVRKEATERFPSESPPWHSHQRDWIGRNPPPPTSVKHVADHVEHVRDVAGVDHVGLGGDFDGVEVLPTGLSGVDCYPALIDELARRSWSQTDLAKLSWLNALRVLRDTELAGERVDSTGK